MYLNRHWDSMSSDDLKVFNGTYMTFQTKPVECTKIIDMIIKIPSKLEVAPPLSKMCEWVMEWVIPFRLLRL